MSKKTSKTAREQLRANIAEFGWRRIVEAPDSGVKLGETVGDVSASIFLESLSAIRAEIRGIIAGSIKPTEHDATSRIAWLAQRAAAVSAEQRKAEQGEVNAIRKLSPVVVLTWIRQQTAEYRAKLLRDISGIDATERRSVLG